MQQRWTDDLFIPPTLPMDLVFLLETLTQQTFLRVEIHGTFLKERESPCTMSGLLPLALERDVYLTEFSVELFLLMTDSCGLLFSTVFGL